MDQKDPKILRPETLETNLRVKQMLISQTHLGQRTRRRYKAYGFCSVGLEALAPFPIAHDCLEEREKAFRVFPRLHGADLVLNEVTCRQNEWAAN